MRREGQREKERERRERGRRRKATALPPRLISFWVRRTQHNVAANHWHQHQSNGTCYMCMYVCMRACMYLTHTWVVDSVEKPKHNSQCDAENFTAKYLDSPTTTTAAAGSQRKQIHTHTYTAHLQQQQLLVVITTTNCQWHINNCAGNKLLALPPFWPSATAAAAAATWLDCWPV